jgi:plasmid stability protein
VAQVVIDNPILMSPPSSRSARQWLARDGANVVPKWIYNETMPVTLSIKNVPDKVVERLRSRAIANRRSLQGELLAIVERVAGETAKQSLTVAELHEWAKAQGFRGTGNSADDIRRMRDARSAHLDRVLDEARGSGLPKVRVKPRGRR